MNFQLTDQLRLLVDAQTEYAIFLLSPAGVIETWNTGAERLKGYAPHEIIGEHFSRFYTPEDIAREHPQNELEIAFREGRYEEEGWRLRKDGSRFWANVMITALRDETGELRGFGKVTRDLTGRRLAEEQLRATANELRDANAVLEEFRLLVAGVRDYAIFMLDAGGYIRTWNAGAEELKQYTEAEVLGRHFSLFYTPEDCERDHPAHELEIAARVGRYEEEGWRVRRDGTHFWANVVITALRNEHGTLIGFGKVTRDLTERRANEERLRSTAEELARSNAELDQFAWFAAHDLVEPLQTVAGMADLVDRRYAGRLDDDGREFLAEITAGARRMRARVDALLDYARESRAAPERERVALGPAVEEAVRTLHIAITDRGAAIGYDGAAMPAVLADRGLLGSVLQNLISNAIKFSEGDAPSVRVTAEPTGDGHVRVTVADEGIGIAPQHLEKIFAVFGRLHSADAVPGSGIGLALCERLVHRQGGEIGVDSTPGEGSRFWFTLPAG